MIRSCEECFVGRSIIRHFRGELNESGVVFNTGFSSDCV
jgi:hypothetical protein